MLRIPPLVLPDQGQQKRSAGGLEVRYKYLRQSDLQTPGELPLLGFGSISNREAPSRKSAAGWSKVGPLSLRCGA